MSSEFTNTTIKRFTYDWLIRFAELHPLQSRHADISPRFCKLLTRHALEVVAFDSLIMIGGNYWEKTGTKCRIDTTSPHRKKQLYVCNECFLINLTPGMITTFEKDRVFFNGVALNIIAFQPERKLLSFSNLLPILPPVFMSTITPKELKYLLKYRNATKAILLEVQLAEPIMFSEIWPLMETCDTSIKISIGNFIYDKDMAAVFRKNPIRQSELYFHRMNLSDTEVLALFDYLLSLQVRPTMLSLRFEKKMPVELARAINAKYNSNGLRTIFFPLPTTPFNAIIIQESQLNGKAVCCEYSLNHSLSADIIP